MELSLQDIPDTPAPVGDVRIELMMQIIRTNVELRLAVEETQARVLALEKGQQDALEISAVLARQIMSRTDPRLWRGMEGR